MVTVDSQRILQGKISLSIHLTEKSLQFPFSFVFFFFRSVDFLEEDESLQDIEQSFVSFVLNFVILNFRISIRHNSIGKKTSNSQGCKDWNEQNDRSSDEYTQYVRQDSRWIKSRSR